MSAKVPKFLCYFFVFVPRAGGVNKAEIRCFPMFSNLRFSKVLRCSVSVLSLFSFLFFSANFCELCPAAVIPSARKTAATRFSTFENQTTVRCIADTRSPQPNHAPDFPIRRPPPKRCQTARKFCRNPETRRTCRTFSYFLIQETLSNLPRRICECPTVWKHT